MIAMDQCLDFAAAPLIPAKNKCRSISGSDRKIPVGIRKSEVAETFLPIIHLVFSNLKTWLRGIHHGVSPQHLQAYLNEFTFRFNRRFYPFNAFRSLLGIAGDVTAPTYAELYAKKSRSTTSSGCV